MTMSKWIEGIAIAAVIIMLGQMIDSKQTPALEVDTPIMAVAP